MIKSKYMEQLDKAIEALTQLRIQAVKEKRNDLEQKLYEIEMLIFKTYDNLLVILNK